MNHFELDTVGFGVVVISPLLSSVTLVRPDLWNKHRFLLHNYKVYRTLLLHIIRRVPFIFKKLWLWISYRFFIFMIQLKLLLSKGERLIQCFTRFGFGPFRVRNLYDVPNSRFSRYDDKGSCGDLISNNFATLAAIGRQQDEEVFKRENPDTLVRDPCNDIFVTRRLRYAA